MVQIGVCFNCVGDKGRVSFACFFVGFGVLSSVMYI